MSGVVPASEHAVRAPTPVIDVCCIVAGNLLVAGLRRRWNGDRHLDGRSVFSINLVVAIVRIRQFEFRLGQHIRIIDVFPSLSSTSALRLLIGGS